MHDIYLHREKGQKARGDKTQAKDGREGGRDIHPCWGFVAANVFVLPGTEPRRWTEFGSVRV